MSVNLPAMGTTGTAYMMPNGVWHVFGDADTPPFILTGYASPCWIPVSKRLPEDIQAVLCWMDGRALIGGRSSITETWWFVEETDGGEPTHWMPLPEPPKP